jgi:hypothetical protein
MRELHILPCCLLGIVVSIHSALEARQSVLKLTEIRPRRRLSVKKVLMANASARRMPGKAVRVVELVWLETTAMEFDSASNEPSIRAKY